MRIEGGAGEGNWSENTGWSWRGELERRTGVRIEGGAGEATGVGMRVELERGTGVRIEGGAGEGDWSEDRGWSWRGDLE